MFNISSQPVQASRQTSDHVNIAIKYPDVGESDHKDDTVRTMLVNSLSDDKRDITKLGDIVYKFTSSQPLAQQYTSLERESHISHDQLNGEYGVRILFT